MFLKIMNVKIRVKNMLTVFLTGQRSVADDSPWDILNDTGITEVAAMRQMSASYYRLMVALGAVGILTSFMAIGLKLIWAKNARNRREGKEEFLFKILSGIAIFAYVALAGMLYKAVVKLV